MPKLSIIVGTLNRPDQIQRLVKSVVENTKVDWELIILDAGTTPPPLFYYLQLTKDRIRIVEENPRLGHIKGYNIGFRMAQGEYVTWLNDDAIVMPGWDSCVEMMDRNPWIGMGILRFGTNGDNFLSFEYQGLPYANFGILRKELGDKVEWFDDDILYFYGGDNSLTFKVFLKGKPVVPLPGKHVIHYPHMDSYRIDNEARQAADAAALMTRYRDLLPLMYQTFSAFRERRPV